MKRLLIAAAASLSLLLGGCASTVRSDVTTFHEWPAAMADKSYAFDQLQAQEDTLELRSYQNLVRSELARLGFREVTPGSTPNLKVAMRFMTTDMPVRTLEPAFPMYAAGPRLGFGHPFYRPYYGGRRYWGGWYTPFYDSFWSSMPSYTETIEHVYKREMQVEIKYAATGQRLFDVTVHNTSRTRSTPMMMPALVQSAFAGFPGVSGAARRVELNREG